MQKKIYFTLGILLALILACFIYLRFGPYPSARYYSKILTEIEAPAGYSVDQGTIDIRSGGLGGSPYAREIISGPSEATKDTRQAVADKLKSIGFKHIEDTQRLSPSEISGIRASCKNTSVDIRFNMDGNPIRIEVYKSSYPDTPLCPWLF